MKIVSDSLLLNSPENSPITLVPEYVGQTAAYSVQVKCLSGSITVKLQCSTDKGSPESPVEALQSSAVTTWTDIKDASQVLAAGDDVLFDATDVSYGWVRVVCEGSGQIEMARINKKGF